MDFEKEMNDLKVLVKQQQDQICWLERKVQQIDGELTVIDEQMNRPGKNGYPSLYDGIQKLIEKGWLKEP
jgi:hypothetical protein